MDNFKYIAISDTNLELFSHIGAVYIPIYFGLQSQAHLLDNTCKATLLVENLDTLLVLWSICINMFYTLDIVGYISIHSNWTTSKWNYLGEKCIQPKYYYYTKGFFCIQLLFILFTTDTTWAHKQSMCKRRAQIGTDPAGNVEKLSVLWSQLQVQVQI
jgi:hypothetical protein